MSNSSVKIDTIDICDASKQNTLQYSVETFDRAFGDYRDGLKPVHRKILWTMFKNQTFSLTKVATTVGSTLEFHPHGDASVLDALVNMAQPWRLNYPYIEGKGNFGTQDGDSHAAARYIEAKASQFSRDVIFEELDNVAVDYVDNFDYKSTLPSYFPSKIPLILINGMSGIGVGFKADMPPHNLNDIADRCIQYIKNKKIKNDVLCEGLYPDFPTGGEILNGRELSEFYKHGTPCTIQVRGKADFDTDTNTIILKEFPYGVDIDSIEKVVTDEIKNGNMVLGGIESILDNTHNDDNVSEIVEISKKTFEYTCKKEANMVEILNEICRVSNFKTSISLSFITNNRGYLKYVNVKDIIEDWYKIRFDTKRRRHTYNISQAQGKLHLYEGILFIYDRKKEVIEFISESKSVGKEDLIIKMAKKFGLTKTQARGIYEMPLGRLNNFGLNELRRIIEETKEKIDADEYILTHIDETIINELMEVKKKYGRPRKTTVIMNYQVKSTEKPIITRGAFVYSHAMLSLCDINGCRDSKGIMTGLRPWRGSGKPVKEIVGGNELRGNPIGFVVCYSDGTAQLIDSSVFKVLNVWYDTKCDEKDQTKYISSACTYYKESDEFICLTQDLKVKRIILSDLSKRAVSCGGIITSIVRHDVESEVLDCLFCGKSAKGLSYSAIPISDIPILGRGASGVKIGYDAGDIKLSLLSIGNAEGEERMFIATVDKEGQHYIHSLPTDAFKIQSRMNKPKPLPLPLNQDITSVFEGVIDNKENILCMIGKNSTATLSVTNFKKPFSFKKLFLSVVSGQIL